MASIPSIILNSRIRKTVSGQKVKSRTVTLKEQPSVNDTSTVWVRNDNPDVLVFTDDAGTDFVLNAVPAASDLSSVLTAGNDATGLDITNLGSLTFDTAGPQGINIGTDVTGATTVLASQIAIGPGSTVGADNANSTAIGVNAIIDATGGTGKNIAIGTFSTVNGIGVTGAIAIGSVVCTSYYGVCIGYDTATSSGKCAIKIGWQGAPVSTGDYSISIGAFNHVLGSSDKATCIGYKSYLEGDNSVCIGNDCYLTGNYCVAIGNRARTTTNNCISIGSYSYNQSSGPENIAIGFYSTCGGTANGSIAFGRSTTVTHANSVVIGSSLSSTTTNEVSLGIGANHIRFPFTLDPTPPTGGIIVLPNASTMLNVTVNGALYQIPLFDP